MENYAIIENVAEVFKFVEKIINNGATNIHTHEIKVNGNYMTKICYTYPREEA